MDLCRNLYKPWNIRGRLCQSNHWFLYLKSLIHSYFVRNDDWFQNFPEIYGKIHCFIVYLKSVTFDHYIRREMDGNFRDFSEPAFEQKRAEAALTTPARKVFHVTQAHKLQRKKDASADAQQLLCSAVILNISNEIKDVTRECSASGLVSFGCGVWRV